MPQFGQNIFQSPQIQALQQNPAIQQLQQRLQGAASPLMQNPALQRIFGGLGQPQPQAMPQQMPGQMR